jgi:hypothetical protein
VKATFNENDKLLQGVYIYVNFVNLLIIVGK